MGFLILQKHVNKIENGITAVSFENKDFNKSSQGKERCSKSLQN